MEQKQCIQQTPFWWFVFLHERVKISRNLLCELSNVWVESRGGFMINSEFVSFKLLDVCVGLGLRVYGDRIDLEEVGVDSVCRKKFSEKKVTISMVYNYLLTECECLDVEDYCRLYILLGISEFLLPNRNGAVFVSLFGIVDDLTSLVKYNWGGVVYSYLVGSLSSASVVLKKQSDQKHFHVVGCVYLLQVSSFVFLQYRVV